MSTTTGYVNVSSAIAPTAGQVLTATSPSTATWQTPASESSTGYKSFSVIVVTADYFNSSKIYNLRYDQDSYVFDSDTITSSGYYVNLPSGLTNGQKVYILATNIYHGFNITFQDSRCIYPRGGGANIIHNVILAFNQLISFTYYTSDMPGESSSTAIYPCWFMDDTYSNTYIPIPISTQIIFFNSYNATNGFSTNLILQMMPKQKIEIIDIMGYLTKTTITLRNNTGNFYPINASTFVCNNNNGIYFIYSFDNNYFARNMTFMTI